MSTGPHRALRFYMSPTLRKAQGSQKRHMRLTPRELDHLRLSQARALLKGALLGATSSSGLLVQAA